MKLSPIISYAALLSKFFSFMGTLSTFLLLSMDLGKGITLLISLFSLINLWIYASILEMSNN
jgi:hypothetical protein